MTVPVVFVHGSGRSGRAAWGVQTRTHPGGRFVVLPGFGPDELPQPGIAAAVETIREAVGGRALVVASSFGAIPAAVLATTGPVVAGLVLAEPALYSIARGEPGVEDLIARMSPVYARRGAGDLGGWWAEAMTTLTGQTTEPPTDVGGSSIAARFAAQGAPWDYEIDMTLLSRVPMTVVTGGWNREYEEIAERLQSAGAEWHRLEGFGHRVADHPDFSPLVDTFLSRIDRAPR